MPAMASQSFAAKKLTVKPAKKTIYVKKSVTLKANQKVKWSASKASLKVVKLTSKKAKSVKVTGKKAGKAVVTAKVGKQTKKVTITVKKAKAAVKKTAVTAVAISADNAADPAKTLAVGTKLRAAVTPANATVTYQWKADGTAIAGPTDATFTVTTAETGKAITVEVTGIDNFEGTAVSTATAKVATAELTTVELKAYNVTTGKYDGQAITKDSTEGVGTKLKAVVTTDPTGADVATFQWYRSTKNANGTDATTAISGATSSEYTLTKEDIGTETKVFVVVTPNAGVKAGTNLGQNTVAPYKGSWVSKNITVSGEITPFVQANGKAVNSVVYGTKVTVGGVPADANVTYQWYSNTVNSNQGGTAISGATGTSYTVTGSVVGTTYYYVECSASGVAEPVKTNAAAVTVKDMAVVSPTVTPAPGCPVITVQPTGANADGSQRTVAAGGSISYTAAATGADSFKWYLVGPGGSPVRELPVSASSFTGLTVGFTDTGDSSSRSNVITLNGVPQSLNGWCVQIIYTNAKGNTASNGAIIHATNATTPTALTTPRSPTGIMSPPTA